jgi:hypothetical protein
MKRRRSRRGGRVVGEEEEGCGYFWRKVNNVVIWRLLWRF